MAVLHLTDHLAGLRARRGIPPRRAVASRHTDGTGSITIFYGQQARSISLDTAAWRALAAFIQQSDAVFAEPDEG